MRDLQSLALKVEGGRLFCLDQRRLPHAMEWVDGDDPQAMHHHIHELVVRGAPLIGVAAALCLARYAESGASHSQLLEAYAHLRSARPTAVNLMWALDRMKVRIDAGAGVSDLVREAEAIFDEDVALCQAMARHGATLFDGPESVLTHCNAGALATAGIGTAVGVIRYAFEQGKISHVYVDETRPLLQGARLTAWEMAQAGIPHTLITDSMAAIVMREGCVQRVLVGADRVAMNGDFANKVGTYGLSILARHHGIPFHPVAPMSTVDACCASGKDIPIELRSEGEVKGFGDCQWGNPTSPVFNPSFDVTPVENMTSLVLDRGVISREDLKCGGLRAFFTGATEPTLG